METIFLALSGAILVAGVLYWFWSHLQLTQKKVQLLENAVFELRGMMVGGGGGGSGPPEPAPAPVAAATTAAAPYKDLADDGWEDEATEEVIPKSTPLDLPAVAVAAAAEPVVQITREVELNIDELAPGGRIQIGEEEAAVAAPAATADEFRELFISGSGETATATVVSTRGSGETLEGMPVRELRRLAEQRGIVGVADMKKKELLAALRQQVIVPATTIVMREEGAGADAAADAEILE
jgi:hypothetical protein